MWLKRPIQIRITEPLCAEAGIAHGFANEKSELVQLAVDNKVFACMCLYVSVRAYVFTCLCAYMNTGCVCLSLSLCVSVSVYTMHVTARHHVSYIISTHLSLLQIYLYCM